jgi:hypothetical protein
VGLAALGLRWRGRHVRKPLDDPAGEYRVLYASSERVSTFLETLARYRTDPALVAAFQEMADDDQEADRYPTIPPGVVPMHWCESRRIGTARHDGPFADIGQSSSVAHLRAMLASRLVHYGLEDLDVGELRRRSARALTQEISRYVFERGVNGERLLGIRYLSRLGDDIENWAIFEGSEPYDNASEEISRDDPDLVRALEMLGLVVASSGLEGQLVELADDSFAVPVGLLIPHDRESGGAIDAGLGGELADGLNVSLLRASGARLGDQADHELVTEPPPAEIGVEHEPIEVTDTRAFNTRAREPTSRSSRFTSHTEPSALSRGQSR